MSAIVATDQNQPRWIGAAASALLHAVLITLVLTQLQRAGRGTPAPQGAKAIQITFAPPSRQPPERLQRPAPPVPPKPIEPPKQQLRLTDEPAPAAPKPVPPVKPPPSPPAAASAPPKPLGAPAPQAAPAPPVPPVETPEQSLIGRIHDNWLEPATMPRQFRCRIRIDYQPGGRILAVNFLHACGDYSLEESVRKAIWKTQPLPLLRAKTEAGTVEIEFTP